jgi:hypothetical protein
MTDPEKPPFPAESAEVGQPSPLTGHEPTPEHAPSKEEANSAVRDERHMLEGPRARWSEFFRVFRIASEFIRGFRRLHFQGPCVTVFGSARFREDHQYYHLARELGGEIAKIGFTVMTGGGPVKSRRP